MPIKNLFQYWTYQMFAPGQVLREKYEAFKSLLENDKRAHEWMAELEEIYHDRIPVDFSLIQTKYDALSDCVRKIVEDLRKVTPSRYLDLEEYYRKLDGYVRYMLAPQEGDAAPPYTLRLQDVADKDDRRVGGKALHLARLNRSLDLSIPHGFIITTNAFYRFIEHNELRSAIDEGLAAIDILDSASLNRVSERLMQRIRAAAIPSDTEGEIRSAFEGMGREDAVRVAVRSSAVGEDSRSSFAGQYRTVLNVRSHQLLDAYKEVLASKYAPEALYYRIHFGLTDVETPMAVLVLEMIDSRASGVMYTTEVGSSSTGRLEIRSIWGLGELLVQGEVSPDRFRIEKGVPPKLVEQRIRPKAKRMAFDRGGGTRVVDVDADSRSQASLDEALVLALARWGMELEAHYGEPQDVEWCLGPDGRLFLLQARPLKTGGERFEPRECPADEIANPVLLAAGKRASPGVGAGSVCHVRRTSDLDRVPKNAVLVSRHASARYVRILGKLSAVVTETGSTAGHFSSVAREFGVPAIVNASGAMDLLKEGVDVTVHADERKVYQGIVSALVESPCVRKDLSADSPYARRLEYVIRFTSPLRLMDPEDAAFSPGGCRSMHDIIRFAHEKSVQEMFTIGERKTGRRMGARKLLSDIPLPIYLLDLDGGIAADSGNEIEIADVKSAPFLAVWKGLNHPNIQWSHFTHYNWEEYDRIVMSGGFVRADSAQLASYAVLSREYLNLNLKFGYHFVILDTICSERSGENHIRIRFTGGGGDLHGRCLRADFVSRVLERLGFEVSQKSDLVDADLSEVSMEVTKEKLDWTGRLLGATRLMDMYLKEEHQVDAFVDDFVNGRYHFSTVAME